MSENLLSVFIGVVLVTLFTILFINGKLNGLNYPILLSLTALVCLVIPNYKNISELKLGKYSVTLQQKLDDANNLLFDTSKIMLMQLYERGGFQSITSQQVTKIRNQIFDTLHKNKIDEQKIQELLDFEYPYVTQDYYWNIAQIFDYEESRAMFASDEERQKIQTAIRKTPKESRNAETLEKFTAQIDNAFLKQQIENFKYYELNKKHKDEKSWMERDKWASRIKKP